MDNRFARQGLNVKRVIPSERDRYTDERFAARPTFAAGTVGYGDPTGTTGDTNIMQAESAQFEYHIKGTQTILAPVWSSAGLNIAMDLTNNDGVEITQGITAASKSAFTVGTDKFFAQARITLTDVSGTDDCAFGFRKAAAYAANIDDYTDMAALNIQAGTINLETILNNAATTTTDTTDDVADGETVLLRLEVGTDRKIKAFVDGVRVLSSNTFTFDVDDVLIPFLFFLHDSDVAETTLLTRWNCGLL